MSESQHEAILDRMIRTRVAGSEIDLGRPLSPISGLNEEGV
jgi:hypothetical protein